MYECHQLNMLSHLLSPKAHFSFLASQEVMVVLRKSFYQGIQDKITREEGFTGKNEPMADHPHLWNSTLKHF